MRFITSLIAFCIISLSYAQEGTYFEVCDVEKVDFDFRKMAMEQALGMKFGKGVEAFSQTEDSIIYGTMHPFVETVHNAYAKHRKLVISPDMVWLMIAQGFAKHVDENADSLRHYFVDFDGKKVLKVVRNEFKKGSPDNDWEGVFPDFTRQIAAYTGEELLNNTVIEFSTTTHVERAAMEVTLMDAMSNYFIYAVGVTCGIPEIELEGSPTDWETILERAKNLSEFELDWWIDELVPILEEFVDASNGKVNQSFWREIYQREMIGCGSPAVSGWITKFFPYVGSNQRTRLSSTMDHGDFSSGYAKADFYWVLGQTYQMEFIAGFTGMTEDPKTGALRPHISWAIRDSGKTGVKEEDKEYEKDILSW